MDGWMDGYHSYGEINTCVLQSFSNTCVLMSEQSLTSFSPLGSFFCLL